MILQKIICDRCNKVIFDSERKSENTATELFDAFFKDDSTKDIGYAEVNIIRFDGKRTDQHIFCEQCYDIAVKAWNKQNE